MAKLQRSAVVLLAAAAAACSAIRFGGADADLAGTWTGSLQLEGQTIGSSLVLSNGDDDLSALFSAPSLRLQAAGEGSWDGVRLTLQLDYDLQCPGVLRMEGTVEPRDRLSGKLEARDCTGTVLGTFSLQAAGADRSRELGFR